MDIALRAVRSGHFETLMFPFNFITDEAAEELIPLALERDVGFIAMKPMAGGALEKADLAFRYLRQFPQILPIPGIERTEEMEEIVGIMEDPAELTSDELVAMDRMRTELGNRFCRRCGYCEPCPNGVPTQALMILDSMVKRFPLAVVSDNYAQALDAAEQCTSCGECEDKCPYGLPIREMIEQHVELLHREKAQAGIA
jgi:predicted aldo/keto reductase-like oxidoreductase